MAEADEQVMELRKRIDGQKTEIETLQKDCDHMKKQIHQINNPTDGQKGASLPWYQQLFIKLVTPKLVHFDKPFLVAVISSVLTLGILGVILWYLMGCSTEMDFKIGTLSTQVAYVSSIRSAGKEVCLQGTKALSTGSAAHPLLLIETQCKPSASFAGDWTSEAVKDFVSAEDLSFATGLNWCDGAEDSNQNLCEKESSNGVCQQCVGTDSVTRVAFSTLYKVTTCPKGIHVAFWIFAVANKIALLMTFFIVLILLAAGVLKQYDSDGKLIGLKDAVKNDATTAVSLNA
eukprot:TRINITY_DN20036_c0_g1_i3.p1 TRINITY_DN20036_c0_g1~~TRINITY_DN20036_c0_g1_i3.p1  ORF type:complete len:289 (-),score=68.78 TRINITY_DN20036_c0_g1_i3:46-912(-)